MHDMLLQYHAHGSPVAAGEARFVSGAQSQPLGSGVRRQIVRLLLAVTAALFVAGCGTDVGRRVGESSAAASPGGDSSPARPLGQYEDGSISARQVVAALALRGFLVPNLLDITDQICPAAGCDQSLVADTLRVTSFPTPNAATRYAQEHKLRHLHNVVVALPPVMVSSEQDRYWSAIVRIFP
jgi:hypothetical protein